MINELKPVSKFYHSQGLKLHYLDWGNETAPPLILLHGMRDHAHCWDWVARELRCDWHVIAPDLRGHGDSAWSPDGAYLTPYHLLDLADLIESLRVEQVNIVAHSFGGNPAARYAGLYPQRVRKLVLVDAMGPYLSVLERWNQIGPVVRTREWLEKQREIATGKPRRLASLDDAIARMAKNNPHLSAEQVRHLAQHAVRQHDDGLSWKYDPLVGTFLPEDFEVHLSFYWREITAPTLICWGPKSWTRNPATDASSDFFRDHRNMTFDNAGHWLHLEAHDAFVAALKDFL
jgi:pimeloyl-ACP methyl ester carboxylesterase